MKNNVANSAVQSERKAQLLLNDEIYRIGILQGQMSVIRSLRAKSLLSNAVEQVVDLATARLAAVLAPNGGEFASLMPLAAASISFLSDKKNIKPAVGVGLIAMSIISLFWWCNHKSVKCIPSSLDKP